MSVGEDLDAFLRRLSAVLSRCRDLALVDSLLAVDDGASPARREAIVRAFPFVRPIAVLTRGALERELAAHDFVIDLGDSVPRGPFTLGDAVRALRQRQAQSTGVAAAPWPG